MEKFIQFVWSLIGLTVIMEKVTKGQALYKNDIEYRCKRVN